MNNINVSKNINQWLINLYLDLFELFDFNKDGKICYEDLLLNLKLLLCNSLNEEQLIDIGR